MNWFKYIIKNIIKIIPALVLGFIFLANHSLAAYTVEMRLPNAPASFSGESGLGQYIQALFQFGFYLIAFLAVAMITYGGVLYMIPNKIAEAKERIWGAVIGIVFLLCSFLILQTIDPNLLKLSPKYLPSASTLKPATDTGRTGVSTTGATMSIYFDSTAPAYDTREKCEAVGRASYRDKFIGVIFNTINCTIVVKKN